MVQTVHLSMGDASGEEYITQLVADLVVHSWDLARAIGGNETLDASLVQAAAAWFSGVAEPARQAGIVGPPLPVPDTADPQTKLLADFGRDASQPAHSSGAETTPKGGRLPDKQQEASGPVDATLA